MPTALVLTLRPETSASVPAFLERAVHAWFLDQVRPLDASLAETLQAPSTPS
jgi:hypothetical protein